MAERATNEENTTMNGNMLAAAATRRGVLADRRLPLAIAVALAVCGLALVFGMRSDSASANSKIFAFASTPSSTQAGGHPDVFTTFELGSRETQEHVPCECNDPKDIIQHVPPGVIANPHVVAECPIAQLAQFQCPADSQAGVVALELFGWAVVPLYRTIPQTGQAGLFAFSLPFGVAVPQYLAFNARTGSDYGLDSRTIGISHILPLLYYAPVFWGVPGSHFNDPMRFRPGENAFGCIADPVPAMEAHDSKALTTLCPELTNKSVPSSLPIAPMMQNPTSCSGPLLSTMVTVSYDLGTDEASAPWPETTGCDRLSFNPSLAANPTTTNTDTASGVEVVLKVPQPQDPNVPSQSELKANTVTMPPGFSLNPSAAAGKTSCTDAQSSVGTEEEAHCPEFSKIGTVTLDSSALPAPIGGYIYIGQPKPGEPYRLVLTANGFGTAVKLLGTTHSDPQTGQLTTTFENLPQTPFQEFTLHFFGSERGLLATPPQCGTYPVQSAFTPWDGDLSQQTQTQFFVLDHGPNGSPCPPAVRDFTPGFEAGVKDNTGGVHTPFGMKITREDGQQNLSGVTIKAPPGFLATLRGVQYCPEATIASLSSPAHSGQEELANPACPAGSEVGRAVAGSGAGTHPLYNRGRVYLAGPYKGAPLSLVSVVPAVGGPYDFGNVVVRVVIDVDPATAQVSAVSDPLPQIVAGVPLRIRMIQLELSRPDFTLNPTNCEPFSFDAAISGDQGGLARRSAPFQVGNCTDLAYDPKLDLHLSGGVNRRGHPAIRAVLTQKPGEANSQAVGVTLPPGELLDNSHIGTSCTRPAFAAHNCPKGSVLGTTEAFSPLLDQPLKGTVYLRASNHRLPDLAIDLEGQFQIELVGRVDSVHGRLRVRFESLPDAPVSKVVFDMAGGAKGLLQNSKSLCGKPKSAKARMTGQNGLVVNRRIPLDVSCGSRGKRKRHGRHARAVR
jgi:hypothetical protein